MQTEYLAEWILYFYIYCFLGWIWESAFVSVRHKKLVNRGFMKGPLLPIYGSGALCVLLVALPLRGNYILMALAGMAAATLLEYVTGAVMEALFRVRYWDYTGEFLNINGYVCLKGTLCWGVMTLVMVYVVHQPIAEMVSQIPRNVLHMLDYVITALAAADFATSFKAAIDFRDVLLKAERMKEELRSIQARLDELEQLLEEKKDALVEGVSSRKDALVEGVSSRKDALMEGVSSRKDALVEGVSSRKDALVEGVSSYKDALVEEVSGYKDALVEEVSGYKDALVEEVSGYKDVLVEEVSSYKDTLVEGVSNYKDALVESVSSYKDSLMEGMSRKLDTFAGGSDRKEAVLTDGAGQPETSSAQETAGNAEMAAGGDLREKKQLQTEWQELMRKKLRTEGMQNGYSKSIRGLLRRNPHTVSKKYPEALKDIASRYQEKKEKEKK